MGKAFELGGAAFVVLSFKGCGLCFLVSSGPTRRPLSGTYLMGFWGFYRLDEDTADAEHVIKRRVRHETDPKIELADVSFLPSLRKRKV